MPLPMPLLPAWTRWAGVALVAATIFVFSVLRAPPEPVVTGGPLRLDQWRHLLAYAGLGTAVAYATVDWRGGTWSVAVAVVMFAALYGVGIELLQGLLPGRYLSVGDMLANAVNALGATPMALARHRIEWLSLERCVRRLRGPPDTEP